MKTYIELYIYIYLNCEDISTFTVYFFQLVQASASVKRRKGDKSKSQVKILKKWVSLRYVKRQKSDGKP